MARKTFASILLSVTTALAVAPLSAQGLDGDSIGGGSLPADYDCTQEEAVSDMEDLYGPGNVTGISGNGALTAGFGYAGELTLLRWPNPSFFDQIRYLTPFFTESCETRKKPRNGAKENMGSFAGLFLVTDADPAGMMHWFRDPDWTHAQSYLTPDSAVLVTESVHADPGIVVREFNVVLPGRDVLVRRYEIERTDASPVRKARVVYYENLQIITEKIPYAPIKDSLLERTGDFAVLYHSGRDALVHFRPQHPAKNRVPGKGATQEEIDRWINEVDVGFPFDPASPRVPVYFAVGADFSGLAASPRSDGHQCGRSGMRRAGAWNIGAFYDSLDGNLGGNSIATGDVDGALMKALDPAFGKAAFTVFFAAAGTGSAALDLLDEARVQGWENLLAQAEAAWKARLKDAHLPNTDDPRILSVCKRALIGVLQGYNAGTGAFVASVTTQPPYDVNWTRDGVYFCNLLDTAGFHDIPEKNLRFYANVQRDCEDRDSPNYDIFCLMEPLFERLFGWVLDGTYQMAYYADGVPGGPIFYEIDNAGFANWGMIEHARFLLHEDRFRFLCDPAQGVYHAMRKTANALGDCITPGDESGLQCRALEDDTVTLTQTLNGSMAVYMALDAAIEAGGICGETPEQMERWVARRDDLGAAVEENFWNEAEQRYEGLGAGSYLLWPVRYPIPQGHFEGQARYLFSQIKETLNKEALFSAYIAKAVLALAKAGWDSGDPVYNMKWAVDVLLKEVPTELGHYGEGFFVVDLNNDGRLAFSNRVAMPHLWEASLAYLCAAAYYGLKAPQPVEPEGGCGCSEMPSNASGVPSASAFRHANLALLVLPCCVLAFLRRLFRGAESGLTPLGHGGYKRPALSRGGSNHIRRKRCSVPSTGS